MIGSCAFQGGPAQINKYLDQSNKSNNNADRPPTKTPPPDVFGPAKEGANRCGSLTNPSSPHSTKIGYDSSNTVCVLCLAQMYARLCRLFRLLLCRLCQPGVTKLVNTECVLPPVALCIIHRQKSFRRDCGKGALRLQQQLIRVSAQPTAPTSLLDPLQRYWMMRMLYRDATAKQLPFYEWSKYCLSSIVLWPHTHTQTHFNSRATNTVRPALAPEFVLSPTSS
jgi:hypothetical protein